MWEKDSLILVMLCMKCNHDIYVITIKPNEIYFLINFKYHHIACIHIHARSSIKLNLFILVSHIEKAKDSLYYFCKEQVIQILVHVNNFPQHVKIDITIVFTKEQLSRANEVRRLHYALLHPSDSTLIKSLKYGLIVCTLLTTQDVYIY